MTDLACGEPETGEPYLDNRSPGVLFSAQISRRTTTESIGLGVPTGVEPLISLDSEGSKGWGWNHSSGRS